MPHILQTAAVRTMSQADIWSKTEDECYEWFKRLRWPNTDGKPVCPRCSGAEKVCAFRTRRVFKCSACDIRFSATSGTPFAHTKLSYRKILAAIFCFVNSSGGVPSLRVSKEIGLSYNTALLLTAKAREAMEQHQNTRKLIGRVEVDGSQHWMTRRSPNAHRKWRKGNNTARQWVIVMRERDSAAPNGIGMTKTFVVDREADAIPLMLKHIDPSSTVYLDAAPHWYSDTLTTFFARVLHVNHSANRMEVPGIHTNNAESFNARMRRDGRTYSRMCGEYLELYVSETAWRRDHRTESNGALFARLATVMLSMSVSRRFHGYRYVKKPRRPAAYTKRRTKAY